MPILLHRLWSLVNTTLRGWRLPLVVAVLVFAVVIIGGIVTLTILFTRLASFPQSVRGKRVKGLSQLDVHEHVVLIGYLAGRTERMVGELSVERAHPLVLCASDEVTENPMAENPDVQFVRGDPTSTDVMTRACVARARTVIVDGHDDNESLAIALAVDHTSADLHIVVALREMTRASSCATSTRRSSACSGTCRTWSPRRRSTPASPRSTPTS
ncbi:NAD-binding protein [Pseudonocardia saturnea]